MILFPPATRERWAAWSPTALPLAMRENSDEVETVEREVVERLGYTARYCRMTSSFAHNSSSRPE